MKMLGVTARRCISYSLMFFTAFFAVVTQGAQEKQEAGRFYGLTGELACFNLERDGNNGPLLKDSFKGTFYGGDVVTYAGDRVPVTVGAKQTQIDCVSAVLTIRRDGMEPLDLEVSKKNSSLPMASLPQKPSSTWVRVNEEFLGLFAGVTGLVDTKTKGNPDWKCSGLVNTTQYLSIPEDDIYVWSGTKGCPGFDSTGTITTTISELDSCGPKKSSHQDGVPVVGTKVGNWLRLNLNTVKMAQGKCYLWQIGGKEIKIKVVENGNQQAPPYGSFELENHQLLKRNFPNL